MPQTLDSFPIVIRSANGDHTFTVQNAVTPEQRERGLMFVRSLGPNDGMLFTFDEPQQLSFWMKNTLIPLDMIFIRADSTIARIATAKPLDETPVPAGELVNRVIEINGGRAAQLGIRPGDTLLPVPPCCKP